MPKKLIILSDMHGYHKDAIPLYMQYILDGYVCEYYDTSKLANIDRHENDKHSQFIDSGIDTAIHNLLKQEKGKVTVIAFSIGGTIAWGAALRGLDVVHLIAISSTRLRLETKKPNCKISLLYAEHDKFIPDSEWFKTLDLKPNIIQNETHNMYKKARCRNEITNLLTHSF